jgi:hypothetical protein
VGLAAVLAGWALWSSMRALASQDDSVVDLLATTQATWYVSPVRSGLCRPSLVPFAQFRTTHSS